MKRICTVILTIVFVLSTVIMPFDIAYAQDEVEPLPSVKPIESEKTSEEPEAEPSVSPQPQESEEPTEEPSSEPIVEPSNSPQPQESAEPQPTEEPNESPEPEPSAEPSESPEQVDEQDPEPSVSPQPSEEQGESSEIIVEPENDEQQAELEADYSTESTVTTAEGIVFDTSTGKITGYSGGQVESLVIPSYINGIAVKTLGRFAFSGARITNITLPATLEVIQDNAIDIFGLSNIFVDESNQYFSSNNGILFSKDFTILLRYPIDKQVDSYHIPDGVVEIGKNAFYHTQGTSLVNNLYLPQSLITISSESLGYYATLPMGARYIVDSANPAFKDIDGTLFSKDGKRLVSFYHGSVESDLSGELKYEIPEGVEVIESYAFGYCGSTINNVIFPSTLNKIGSYAFIETDIGLYSNDTIALPYGLEEIEPAAFSQCSYIRELYLPDTVKRVGFCAFSQCWLRKVKLSKSLQTIETNAFSGCPSLVSITIPNNITAIEPYAFSGCYNLTGVNIPSSVETFGYGYLENTVFSGCSSNIVVFGEEGSEAQRFAFDNGIDFSSDYNNFIKVDDQSNKLNLTIRNENSTVDAVRISVAGTTNRFIGDYKINNECNATINKGYLSNGYHIAIIEFVDSSGTTIKKSFVEFDVDLSFKIYNPSIYVAYEYDKNFSIRGHRFPSNDIVFFKEGIQIDGIELYAEDMLYKSFKLPSGWNEIYSDEIVIEAKLQYDGTKVADIYIDFDGLSRNFERLYDYLDFEWTPEKDLMAWRNRITFISGKTYKGVPYSQAVFGNRKNYVYSDKYKASSKLFGINFDEFKRKIADSNSDLYMKNGGTNNNGRIAPYYGADCSSLASNFLGRGRLTTSGIKSKANRNDEFYYINDMNKLREGDLFNYNYDGNGHVMIAEKIDRNSSGNIISIDIIEQTSPQTHRVNIPITSANLVDRGNYIELKYGSHWYKAVRYKSFDQFSNNSNSVVDSLVKKEDSAILANEEEIEYEIELEEAVENELNILSYEINDQNSQIVLYFDDEIRMESVDSLKSNIKICKDEQEYLELTSSDDLNTVDKCLIMSLNDTEINYSEFYVEIDSYSLVSEGNNTYNTNTIVSPTIYTDADSINCVGSYIDGDSLYVLFNGNVESEYTDVFDVFEVVDKDNNLISGNKISKAELLENMLVITFTNGYRNKICVKIDNGKLRRQFGANYIENETQIVSGLIDVNGEKIKANSVDVTKLNALSFSAGQISPEFHSDVYKYNLVLMNKSSFDIAYNKSDENALCNVFLNDQLISGSTINLDTDNDVNYLRIELVSSDGFTRSEYEIDIYRITRELKYDFNEDGEVNVLDMVLIAQKYNTSDNEFDNNSDGIINLFDLVNVAKEFY